MTPLVAAPAADDEAFAHRVGDVTVTVREGDGTPLTDRPVTVEQRRHTFSFGNIGFDFVPAIGGAGDATAFGGGSRLDFEDFAAAWLNLFNTATLPFYWGGYEPRRGVTDVERLTATARWLADRAVTVKGHPLVWHTAQPSWLLGLPPDEVERLLRARIRDLVGGFSGLIDTWDAINEAVIMPVFANGDNAITPLALARGRIHMVRIAFQEARAANPSATLVLNDFDLTSAYECLIEGVLEAGVEIDAIGLQTHMHKGFRGEDELNAVLDRFARYGLPLHMTESTLVSGHLMPAHVVDLNDYRIPRWPTTQEGEARQADEIVRHYRTLVAHPAVRAVNYWGLTDDGAWLGAPVGLLRSDGTRKPSYAALEGLVKGDWWLAPTTTRTDENGRVRVRGFLGDYRVSTDDGAAELALCKDVPTATVHVTARRR